MLRRMKFGNASGFGLRQDRVFCLKLGKLSGMLERRIFGDLDFKYVGSFGFSSRISLILGSRLLLLDLVESEVS